jgi:hypothetical protein
MDGKSFQRDGGRSASFFFVAISVRRCPPPLALEVNADLDKEKSRDGRSGYDLGAGLRDATAGPTSDRVRRSFSLAFPLLSPARPKSRGS